MTGTRRITSIITVSGEVKERKMSRALLKENKTLFEILAGIAVYGCVAQILLLVFSQRPAYRAVGLWTGILCAAFMVIHMNACLEETVTRDEKGATAYARKMVLLRYLVVCAVLVLIGMTGIGDPVLFIVGTFGLKIGAYLQPVTDKVLHVFLKRNSESITDQGGE